MPIAHALPLAPPCKSLPMCFSAQPSLPTVKDAKDKKEVEDEDDLARRPEQDGLRAAGQAGRGPFRPVSAKQPGSAACCVHVGSPGLQHLILTPTGARAQCTHDQMIKLTLPQWLSSPRSATISSFISTKS